MRPPIFLFFILLISLPSARAAEPFEIKEGDRVLLLGDTLLERENTYGYLETRMHEQFPDRHFTVRNLSWAGDTPAGWSRASFDPPEKGFERLKEAIALVKPTVVFLGYGMAASLQEITDRAQDVTLNPDPTRYGAEPMTAARFKKELAQLMDAIEKVTTKDAKDAKAEGEKPNNSDLRALRDLRSQPSVRFVLLSPIRHEDLRAVRPGLPDPAPHNALLEQYSKTVEELAKEKGARFVPFTSNLAEWYRISGLDEPVGIAPGSMLPRAGSVRVFMTDNGIALNELGWRQNWEPIERSFLGWSGNPSPKTQNANSTALRAAVLKKNDLFFHRFRPENATYLFGFRKHEQGQNAVEIPKFDPLIEAAEAEIDRLKKAGATAAKVEPPKPANPLAKAEPPPRPDFTVAEGYQIELWAENPLLEKPTQMNWDAQGRLWVCSSSLYPQIEPGQEANDKILILEDTDRDGKADKSTVFADGLLIPTAVVPDLVTTKAANSAKDGAGGDNPKPTREAPNSQLSTLNSQLSTFPAACYVGQSTELLHFTDTDGDGKADQKRVVFSGFGTEDTHHLIHTLKWGPDGRLYFNQSIYIHSHLETPWGMVRLNSGGVFAYDPRTERVEVLFKGFCNPWGHAWDEWGQSFITDGAGFQGITWGIPGAQYFTYENARKIAPSISPGSYPKFASLELIRSPHFPEDWQGNAITCDFRAHRIVRFEIQDLSFTTKDTKSTKDGGEGISTPAREAPNSQLSTLNSQLSTSPASGYVTKEMPDLVRTSDQSFRPIDVRLGPDGALYVADWSNPVINHGEVDFRDPRRDHHMGRIWRISKKDAPPVKWEPLAGKTNAELLERLLSKSAWEKEQARKTLAHREFGELQNSYFAWINSKPHGVPGERSVHEQGSAEFTLLCASHGLWSVPTEILSRTSLSADPGRRAVAARQIGEVTARRLGSVLGIPNGLMTGRTETTNKPPLERLSADPNPRVRVEAMRALARIPVESPVLTLVPTAESTALVLEAALNSPTTANQKPDDLYDYAAWLSINDLAKPWTDAIASGAWKADTAERQKQLEWGLKSIDPALAGATLSKLVTDGKVPLDGSGPWIELLGQAGGPRELRKVFNLAVGALPPPKPGSTDVVVADGNYPMRSRALGALIEAARLRNLRPEPLDPRQRGWDKDFLAKHATWTSDDADVQELLDLHSALGGGAPAPNTAAHVELRLRITQLMGYLPRGEAGYLEYRAKEDGAPGIAAAACESLARLGQKAMLREIANEGGNDPSSRRHAIVALASLDAAGALTALPAALPALPDDNERLELWRGVLKAKDFADRLVTEIARDTTPWKNAAPKIGVRAAREAGKNGAKLLAALTPLAGLTASEASVPKDFKALADLAKRDGDPARGEMIYRRAALVCTTCHAIGGAGGKVGPDMTSLGASAPLDYIIESVLEPALKVKEGYNAVAFTLKDGTQATGIQARETAQEFILRDVTGREQAVAKAQIATTTNIGSLMPAGLTNQLADRERLDLFAFLGELGKPGPYDASKGKVARVWWLFPGADADKVVGGQIKWESAFPGYTLVDGRFVKDLLAAAAPLVANGSDTLMAVAQFQAAGKTRLTLTGAAKAWLDGKPLALTEDLAPELSEGVHTLAVKLDVNSLPAHLRAESPNARFLGN